MKYIILTTLALTLLACKPNSSTETGAEPADSLGTAAAPAGAHAAFNGQYIFDTNPASGFAGIKKGASREDVEAIFGKENVKDFDFYLGEGYSEPGWVVFQETDRELQIALGEDGKAMMASINSATSNWKTTDGFTIGISHKELMKYNGKDYSLSGFGWDYGGNVTDWNGGQLDKSGIVVTLGTFADISDIEKYNGVMGDQVVSSNNKLLDDLDVRVVSISKHLE